LVAVALSGGSEVWSGIGSSSVVDNWGEGDVVGGIKVGDIYRFDCSQQQKKC